jgi:hypothetical protein
MKALKAFLLVTMIWALGQFTWAAVACLLVQSVVAFPVLLW